MIRACYRSPLGPLTITVEKDVITGIRFDEASEGSPCDSSPVLDQTADWLDRYFSGQAPDPGELPLRPSGTAFQELVWSLLLQIPYGRSRTYGELAHQAALILGVPKMSAQAIGGAVGRNPIVIAIPCHRVLGVNGKLTGFSAGMHRKIFLLQHEQIPFDTSCNSSPEMV